MRRGRIFILLALIIVIGFALIYFVYSRGLIFQSSQATSEVGSEALSTPTPVATTKVVVVTQRVERGDIITADKLDLVDYQADLVLPIMFTDVNQVVGKMARYTMDPYTVVTSALITIN